MLPVRGQGRPGDVVDAAVPVQDHRNLVADRGREKSSDEAVATPIRLALRGGRQVGEEVRLRRWRWGRGPSHLQAASDDPARSRGVQVLGLMSSVASPGPTPTGPRELTGIVDLTRGEDHPRPGCWTWSRKVWHRVQELASRARRRLPCGGANRDAGPFQDTRTPSTINSKTPPASWMPSHRQTRWRRSR